jgi:hypothetical protein
MILIAANSNLIAYGFIGPGSHPRCTWGEHANHYTTLTLCFTEGSIKKGQSRYTGNLGYTRQKNNTICVGHHYTPTNTNNVNKTCAWPPTVYLPCDHCCQSLWIVLFWLPLLYSPPFICPVTIVVSYSGLSFFDCPFGLRYSLTLVTDNNGHRTNKR